MSATWLRLANDDYIKYTSGTNDAEFCTDRCAEIARVKAEAEAEAKALEATLAAIAAAARNSTRYQNAPANHSVPVDVDGVASGGVTSALAKVLWVVCACMFLSKLF